MLQSHLRVLSTGIATARAFTVTALLFTATATALRPTVTALDITAIGVAALTTRIACRSVPVPGGEPWIEQIAGAMLAAAAAFDWTMTHAAWRLGSTVSQPGASSDGRSTRPRADRVAVAPRNRHAASNRRRI